MPLHLDSVYWVPQAISISIQPTLPKRTPTIRAIKPHKHRIELPIPIAQMIMPGHRVRPFAIEAEQSEQTVFRRTMAVRCVGEGIRLSGVQGIEYRALLVGSQQGGAYFGVEATLLGQQLVVVLKDAPPSGALNLSGQSAFAMKTLDGGLLKYCAAILAIQWIVVIATQYSVTGCVRHGLNSVQGPDRINLSIGVFSEAAY